MKQKEREDNYVPVLIEPVLIYLGYVGVRYLTSRCISSAWPCAWVTSIGK